MKDSIMKEHKIPGIIGRHFLQRLVANVITRHNAILNPPSKRERERGANSVEAMLMIFVALIILLALIKFFMPEIWMNVKEKINELLSTKT